MFGLGWGKILLIIIFLLIVFGAAKLPQLGDALGKGIKNFQKSLKGDPKDSADKGEDKTSDKQEK